MSKLIQYLLRILFSICLCVLPVCGSLPPVEGVITEIISIKEKNINLKSKDGFYSYAYTSYTISQRLNEVHDYLTNHGGIVLSGYYKIQFDGYGLYKNAIWQKGYYVRSLKRDNFLSNSNISYTNIDLIPSDAPTGYTGKGISEEVFSINVTFDDPTISTPESHVYTLEFWECVGECKIDEYDKKTDKKGEIVINYSVVP